MSTKSNEPQQQGGEVVAEIHATGYADGTRAVKSRGDIRALTLWLAQTEGGLPDEIERCITERDQARGALLLLGYEGVISQSRARELLSMPIEEQRRWYREQFAAPAPAAPAGDASPELMAYVTKLANEHGLITPADTGGFLGNWIALVLRERASKAAPAGVTEAQVQAAEIAYVREIARQIDDGNTVADRAAAMRLALRAAALAAAGKGRV